MADNLHAEAAAVRDHLDALLDDLARVRAEAAAVADMAAAAVPSMPDGKPIPPRLLEAARDHYIQMRASTRGPSRTALCQRLRDDCFKLSEEMEQSVWRYLVASDPVTEDGDEPDGPADPWDAPAGDGNGQVTFEDVFGPGGFASVPGSASVLIGDGLRTPDG